MTRETGNILAEALSERFKSFELKLNGEAQSNLHNTRKEAIETFRKLGFPSLKNEEWKYTDLSKFTSTEWAEPAPVDELSLDREAILSAIPRGLESNLLVFVDDQYMPMYSKIQDKGLGVIITTFKNALIKHKELVEQYFSKSASFNKSGTVALNTAYAREGTFIYLPKNTSLLYPVQLLFVSGSTPDNIANIRNLFILEEGSRMDLIEIYSSYKDNNSFTNVVSEIVIKERASLEHYKLQVENNKAVNINLTQIDQAENSLCNQRTVTLGGALVRNDLNFKLGGKHIESHMFGLYIPSGEQVFDNHTFADHAMPDCFSNEFYKGIMMDKSTGVFNGKIMVRQDAQKTNAYQSNKNILLSKEATINTKPQLEIFADDVKCSHGATIGQLDENALFYLRARGIGEATARAMLTYAFAEEIMENFAIDALKEHCEQLLQQKLNQA